MRTLRRIKKLAPRRLRRGAFDLSDATMEPPPELPPEAVFDRLTGPYQPHRSLDAAGLSRGGSNAAWRCGSIDEET
jgi:hypothetical protein